MITGVPGLPAWGPTGPWPVVNPLLQLQDKSEENLPRCRRLHFAFSLRRLRMLLVVMIMNLKGREGCYLTLAPSLISTLRTDKGETSREYHLLLKCQSISCPGKLQNRPVN